MTSAAPIPLTVIGGFLGAGKTTFLNRLLASGSTRCAVLVNDFGEINIDASLIKSHDGTTMSLTNGCVCCSIGSGFLDTLGRVLDSGESFARIVIEASGVGDPWRIAEIALVDPALRLDGVVVLADASRIGDLIDDQKVGDTVRNQFVKCDVVLLSKSDLVDDARRTAACDAVRSVRPDVQIEILSADTVPELSAFDRRQASRFQAVAVEAISDHETDFRRWTYRREGTFDPARLETALRALPPQLLRLKGSCRITGEVAPKIFQMVSRDWSLVASDGDKPPVSDAIVLVGVGTADLPSDSELDAILDRALADLAAA